MTEDQFRERIIDLTRIVEAWREERDEAIFKLHSAEADLRDAQVALQEARRAGLLVAAE